MTINEVSGGTNFVKEVDESLHLPELNSETAAVNSLSVSKSR
jgi:hypothetical protein